MPSYKTLTINTTTEYVDFIRENCKPEDVLFRGQHVDKPLLPKITRLDLKEPTFDAEQKMMREFKRRVVPLLSVQPKSSWDWLAIASMYIQLNSLDHQRRMKRLRDIMQQQGMPIPIPNEDSNSRTAGDPNRETRDKRN